MGTDQGFCDRICGDACEDGSPPADCPIDPCNNRKLCPGAVSCRPDICGETCKAVYFGADGSVIEDCEYVEDSITKVQPVDGAPADGERADGAPTDPAPADPAPAD